MNTECIDTLRLAEPKAASVQPDLIAAIVTVAAYILLLPAAALVMAWLRG